MTDYPDFTVIARLKGEYAGLEKAVALDSEGALQALLYGTYAGANKKLAVDTDGNAQMNLYAQDLEEVINRFKYGAPTFSLGVSTLPILGQNTLYEIIGKGYIYHFEAALSGSATHATDEILVSLDGSIYTAYEFTRLNDHNSFKGDSKIIQLAVYNDIDYEYRVVGLQGYTFETSVNIIYKRNVVDNPSVRRLLTYTVI